MFVLASLMALAAAGAALDLTGSRDPEDDDTDDLPPAIGATDSETEYPTFEPPSVIEAPQILEPWPGIEAPQILEPVEPLDPWESYTPSEPFVPFEPVAPFEPGDTPAYGGAGGDPYVGSGFEIAPARPVDDLIEGGADADNLFGGTGDDTLLGGEGSDWIQGDGSYDAAGDDEIHGGAGDDSLAGQGGDDIIWGDEGDDTIQGGEGNDTLFGGAGNDWLSGNDGDDVLVSGGGGDDLDGGRGNDQLVGGDDPQTVWLHGGEGDDTLMPGAGDFAEGNQGADDFVVRQAGSDLPVIADFDAREDQMILHLPESLAQDARVDMTQDEDGTLLVTVNGDPVVRMLQGGGLSVADIVIVRLPG